MHLLVTGGAGYIGSHTCLELLEQGHQITVVDNLLNSSEESLKRVMQLSGQTLRFEVVDLLHKQELARIVQAAEVPIDGVIHFAGLKALGESIQEPLRYYQNNVVGTLNLLEVMRNSGIRNLIFSSSATVYGVPDTVPITESFPLSGTNPYGRSKLMIEEILGDLHHSEPHFNIALLRYFNPVGAHASGLIGEDPSATPQNLMPCISEVAVGKRERLYVFGDDYPTPDGTGVRDFIHVVDLARGHIAALEQLRHNPGVVVYNLGTGFGYSVLDMVQAFEQASGRKIPYTITTRRPGDVAQCYADPAKAEKELGWKATCSLADMCADTWNWQTKNPQGYT